MSKYKYLILCMLLSGCNSVFQPNTQEMKALLEEYDKHFIRMDGTDHREETRQIDELFKDIGTVYTSDGVSYRIVYYVFTWNTSAVEGARHMSEKIIVFKDKKFVEDYSIETSPETIEIKDKSKVIMDCGEEGLYELDFTHGLPKQHYVG